MGFYARPWKWVKVTHTKGRGWSIAFGPRLARRWFRRGGGGWSTGWGPFSHYFPGRRARRRGRR